MSFFPEPALERFGACSPLLAYFLLNIFEAFFSALFFFPFFLSTSVYSPPAASLVVHDCQYDEVHVLFVVYTGRSHDAAYIFGGRRQARPRPPHR